MTWKRGAPARGRGGGGGPRAVALWGAWLSGCDRDAGLQERGGVRLAVQRGDVRLVGLALLAPRSGAPARERQRGFGGGEHPRVVQLGATEDPHEDITLSRTRTGRASSWARALAAWPIACRNACVAMLGESGWVSTVVWTAGCSPTSGTKRTPGVA